MYNCRECGFEFEKKKPGNIFCPECGSSFIILKNENLKVENNMEQMENISGKQKNQKKKNFSIRK